MTVRRWSRWCWIFAVTAFACGGSTEKQGGGGTGGTPSSGGSPSTGGAPATGGTAAEGGTPSTGGTGATAATGGTPSTGGTPATGGQNTGGSGGTLPAPVICNGVSCASNEECCLTTQKCFDPTSNPGACSAPTDPGPQGQKPCAASSQCAPGEYCQASNDSLCLGPGYCASTTNCPSSFPPAAWCGCNGVTYPDEQTACAAGVKTIGNAACGDEVTVGAGGADPGKVVTYCATDSQCKNGQKCCGITGLCYDPTKPALCAFPPPGTSVPCLDDTQCIQGIEYCAGDGCSSPGGCKLRPGACGGELAPVCGCNGKSYTNADCAAVDGVRIAHTGQCP